MKTKYSAQPPVHCQGAVLIVALVLLLVLTLLGTAGLQDTTMEERMAGNFRDGNLALQAAETALRAGEIYLVENFGTLAFGTAAGSGLYDVTAFGQGRDPEELTNFSADADFVVSDGALVVPGVFQAPDFFIERLPTIEFQSGQGEGETDGQPLLLTFYRITGRGFGVSPNSSVILQSTFLPRFQ